MADFRTEVRRTETSPWYGTKSQAKYVGGGAGAGTGAGNGAGAGGAGRYCTACASSTHTDAQCWGICDFCGGRGHKSELCRKKPKNVDEAAKLARAKAKAEKDKKAKAEKKKKEEARKKAEEDKKKLEEAKRVQTLSTTSGSSGSEDSPIRSDNQLRSDRVGFNQAKRAMHQQLEEMDLDGIKMLEQQYLNAKAVGGAVGGATLEGKLSKHLQDRQHTTELCIADTGCSMTIMCLILR